MRFFAFSLPLLVSATAMAGAPIELSGRPHPSDPQSWHLGVTLTQEGPVTLTCDEVGGSRERHLLRAQGARQLEFVVRGLKADTEYQCRATLADGSGLASPAVSFRTDPLPSDLQLPRITLPSSNPAETGYTLYNYGVLTRTAGYESSYLVILDPDGNARWYYPGVGGGDIDASFIGDEQILFGGHGPNFGPPPHYFPPAIVTLDKTVTFTATRRKASPYETRGTYHHDAGLSSSGDSIFTMVNCLVDKTWRGFAVKEIDFDNNIRWWWDSVTDGVEMGVLPAGSREDDDPFHANTVFDRW